MLWRLSPSLARNQCALVVAALLLARSAAAAPSADAPPDAVSGGAIRVSPLPLIYKRVSAEVGVAFGPLLTSDGVPPRRRYELVISPHVTFSQNRPRTLGNAFGFAGRESTGYGGELGVRRYAASGFFLGPSLLVDVTRPVPGTSSFLSYGVAFDVGVAETWESGLSLIVGAGVMAIATERAGVAFAPRILAAIGYAF